MTEHKCCGEEMLNTPMQDMLGDRDGESWTCLKCGSYYTEMNGILDPEELEDLKENYN